MTLVVFLRREFDMRRNTTPNSAEYKRYAEVARRLAKEQPEAFMWAELALLWENVARYRTAEEALLPVCQLLRQSSF
jgi:hypothetical protein